MANKWTWIAVVVLAALALLAGGGWWVSASPGDLSRLDQYVPLCNYQTLLAGLTQPADPDSFTFVVLGDSRTNNLIGEKVYGAAAQEHPDLFFHTGDLIRSGAVDEYLDHHLPLVKSVAPVPVFSVPGNHERGERRDFAAFEHLHGGDRFSFDYGNSRFVGFNASEPVRVSRGDLAFLEKELSKPGVEHKFVFFHIPPKHAEMAFLGNDRRGFGWNADKLHQLLVRHGVDEVFMGHIHGYASEVLDGVRYTLTAGAGAPLSKELPMAGRVHNYMTVRVTPEGVSTEVVYLDPPTGEWRRHLLGDAPAAAVLPDAA
jgi:3',5'-cyclic AMP phosphodiesterase CpdA